MGYYADRPVFEKGELILRGEFISIELTTRFTNFTHIEPLFNRLLGNIDLLLIYYSQYNTKEFKEKLGKNLGFFLERKWSEYDVFTQEEKEKLYDLLCEYHPTLLGLIRKHIYDSVDESDSFLRENDPLRELDKNKTDGPRESYFRRSINDVVEWAAIKRGLYICSIETNGIIIDLDNILQKEKE